MPALLTTPAVHASVVSDRREPIPGIVILGCRAPLVAQTVRPGQFLMVVPPGGERVATALGVYEVEGERVSFKLAGVGPRTCELASLREGDALDMFGPLGNGFTLEGIGDDVGLVAGGVGIAPLLLPAQRLTARGARVHLYYGARTAGALVDSDRFARLGIDVSFATDDGSRGHHGFVTALLTRGGARHDALAACGPTPMLRALGGVAQRLRVRAQLSLEETFACGVGACWGCVVALDRESAQAPAFPAPVAGENRQYVHARICKEGPVFWAHELRW